MSEWVQHKNDPDGKKWEIEKCSYNDFNNRLWITTEPVVPGFPKKIELPRSEYILVDPPEKWEMCTPNDITIVKYKDRSCLKICSDNSLLSVLQGGLQWARSEKDPNAFIILKKVQL